MLEIVVSIVLLTIGMLGYAVVTAGLVRAFYLDGRRSRAGELIESQREILLRQGCKSAASGSANRFGMPLGWTVGTPGANTRTLAVVITRPSGTGVLSDSVTGVLPCA